MAGPKKGTKAHAVTKLANANVAKGMGVAKAVREAHKRVNLRKRKK